MKRPPSYIGTFPAAARWYLAAITVLSLICVAMHITIQTQAQERAAVLVQAWAEQARVDIGDVRYHLLRNALILRDIHIERGSNKLLIEHILMRASPASLNDPDAHIGAVEISGIDAEYHQPSSHQGASDNVWKNDPLLMALWQVTTSLDIQHGSLTLYLQEHGKTPLVLDNISIQQSMQSSYKRTITASALMYDGSLQWQMSTTTNTSEGQFSWQHVNAAPCYEALALRPMPGYLSGELKWKEGDAEGKQQLLNVQGDLHFKATELDASKSDIHKEPVQRLQFMATQRDDVWKMTFDGSAWPLDAWADVLPDLGGHQLLAGRWDGSSDWRGQPGKWKIKAEAGVLRDVVFSSQQGSDEHDWSWRQIDFDSVDIDTMRQRLRISRVALNNGNLTVNTVAAIAVPQTSAGWGISVEHIQVDELTLNIALSEGMLRLKSLAGKGAWPRRQDLSFKVATAATENPTNTDDPQWRLRGTVARHATQPFSEAIFSMRGKHIPINSLRLLLPLQGDAQSPVTLAGNIDLRSNISVQQGLWRMQGKATAHDVQISHAGDTWTVKQINSRFGSVGAGLDNQYIQYLKAEQWSYIAALDPLQPIHPDQPTASIRQVPWWASVLRDNNINIGHISLNDGIISMGQKDAVWAEQVNIQIDGIAAQGDGMVEQQAASIKAEANVSGGKFTIDGDWHALAEPQRFRGTASLQDATPFFLHTWMTASAMPRLIRGRLNAQINIRDGDGNDDDRDHYQAQWQLQLRGGLTAAVVSDPTDLSDTIEASGASDPMLALSGLPTRALLNHLAQDDGTVMLQDNISGTWQMRALNFDMIGQSLQVALRQAAAKPAVVALATSETPPPTPKNTTHIRLHGREVLSLNERGRLIKLVRLLHQNPSLSIDLNPQWTGQTLSPNLLRRIQRTQTLIERYMVHRKLDKQRIFPRWPTAAGRVDEISFIHVIPFTPSKNHHARE